MTGVTGVTGDACGYAWNWIRLELGGLLDLGDDWVGLLCSAKLAPKGALMKELKSSFTLPLA